MEKCLDNCPRQKTCSWDSLALLMLLHPVIMDASVCLLVPVTGSQTVCELTEHVYVVTVNIVSDFVKHS